MLISHPSSQLSLSSLTFIILLRSLIVPATPIQVLRNADGVGGVRFSGKKRYEGVRFNVICITEGWVGVQFPQKKALSNTCEWPLFSDRVIGVCPGFGIAQTKKLSRPTGVFQATVIICRPETGTSLTDCVCF